MGNVNSAIKSIAENIEGQTIINVQSVETKTPSTSSFAQYATAELS